MAFKPRGMDLSGAAADEVAAAVAFDLAVKEAERQAERESAVNSQVTWLDVGAMLSAPPPPLDFVFPGLMAGTVASLVSPGGAGKSFLTLELAALVAGGVDAAGLTGPDGWDARPKTGKVLYLALEDVPPVLAHRLHDLAAAVGGPAALGKALSGALSLAAIPAGMDILDAHGLWWEWLDEQAEGRRLVVIDTFRLAHQGDENNAGEMARVMSLLGGVAARTGAAILFLHHTSKNAAAEGKVDSQQAARGSSVIVDNARAGFFLQKMTKEESEKLLDVARSTEGYVGEENRWRYVRFGVSKSNASMKWPDVWLRREENGVLKVVRVEPLDRTARVLIGAEKTRGGKPAKDTSKGTYKGRTIKA
jgi:RecA-family ATPase